jgi:hypothetical protein
MEETLVPAYTRGIVRQHNAKYRALMKKAQKLGKAGKHEEARQARKEAQQQPSKNPTDPGYRRLKHVRYADDWLIGFIGPKEEAEEIKQCVKVFLHDVLRLELSEEKTLITHAKTEAARFLGYEISTMQEDSYRPKGGRYANGKVEMKLPDDILESKCQKYLKSGKPVHRAELTTNTVYSIVAQYQAEYRGFVEYYQLANNLHKCKRLKWIMESSLTKTLAHKLKVTVTKVYEKYSTTFTVENRPYKGLQVMVQREGKKPLIARWGGIPLRRKFHAILNDQLPMVWASRTELEKRLLADTCELCGSKEQITVHHIRALKDLHQKGQREKPLWMQLMAARRRKTLVVCWECHRDIQHGRPVRIKPRRTPREDAHGNWPARP